MNVGAKKALLDLGATFCRNMGEIVLGSRGVGTMMRSIVLKEISKEAIIHLHARYGHGHYFADNPYD
jgi:hypothetical protein